MTNQDFFRQRWEAEQGAFAKVIRALPGDRLDYKPHERNTCAGDLAWQLALEQGHLAELLDKGEIDFKQTPAPKELDAIVEVWEKNTSDLRERLQNIDDAKWESTAKFMVDGKSVWETKLGGMFWGYLFDMVHHRGQLSVYLRPMGGKVPSIYGPSADDAGS